jgi:hypothetical protein
MLMKIDELLLKLDERLRTRRKFDAPSDNFVRYSRHLQGDKDFLGKTPIIKAEFFESSDMALVGPGDQMKLGIEFGLPLPEDYLKFCSRFEEYYFVGFAHLHIWNASHAKDTALTFRSIEDISQSLPHRLFHFASNYDLPGFFSFRWSADYKKMDVVYVWDYGDVSVNDLLGPKGDRFVCDTSFTSWLSRMIETDGRPIFPGKRWPMADGGWFDDNFPYFKRLKGVR